MSVVLAYNYPSGCVRKGSCSQKDLVSKLGASVTLAV